VVTRAGGWLFDRVMGGWDVTVFVADPADVRPLQILGTQTLDLDYAFGSMPASIQFYTKVKTVTQRWPSGIKDGAEFSIPTMK
jgi:hypothetical protein